MAKNFELNYKGVNELLTSSEMLAICQGYADNALHSLGQGYSSVQYKGKNRVAVEVKADTFLARRENLENNTILKAIK
jgi:hypothetical protein